MAWAASKAVVAQCPTRHSGCVLWWTAGSQIAFEIDQASTDLGELGLDDAPHGISIWEGAFVWVRSPNMFDPADGHTEPRGTFRTPTVAEWAAIQANRDPFLEPADERPPFVRIADEIAHASYGTTFKFSRDLVPGPGASWRCGNLARPGAEMLAAALRTARDKHAPAVGVWITSDADRDILRRDNSPIVWGVEIDIPETP